MKHASSTFLTDVTHRQYKPLSREDGWASGTERPPVKDLGYSPDSRVIGSIGRVSIIRNKNVFIAEI